MKTSKSASENGSVEKRDGEDLLIVGIGASAGGIQALKEFFENVPADSGVAYVVILHLSPDHESHLSEILQQTAQIPVTQVNERVKVEPNHVYVISPNHHLEMLDGHIGVEPNLNFEERRAPVDIFFRTLAETHQERAISVVLSGTGADGSMGVKRVKERGGAVFVQKPHEAEFGEMPRNSIATDLTDAVLNVREIPAKIIAYKKNLGAVKIFEGPESQSEKHQVALHKIFSLLQQRTGHDFSNYKRATVLRRVQRRIIVRELENLPDYALYLQKKPKETAALLKDLLISVTNFFRDREAFQFLELHLLPRIIEDKTAKDQIRIWVAGCATGEEAYSLGMLLAEKTLDKPNAPSVQIFATDIDEKAITTAREGFYTLNDAADVSPERLRRFFSKDADGYHIKRELREMVLFAKHNVLKDPPFSRLDLITCRNLLIYFNTAAQKQVMKTFHFALNPGSFLFLGTSESNDGTSSLYANVSKEHHIYQNRRASARKTPLVEIPPAFRSRKVQKQLPVAKTSREHENLMSERISFGDLHQQLLEQYAPPSVVVNENYDIVHLSDGAGRFLQIAGGEPTKNLLKLILPELRLELRSALFQAIERRANVEITNQIVQNDGHGETINIHVRPILHGEDTARGFLLVLFEPLQEATASAKETKKVLASDIPLARRLEEELERVKTELRSSVEHYETQTEELRASNEELQSMNEELQSATEELDTSREELQSVNEELLTVNDELKFKVEELYESNNSFQNLLNSTDIGTIFLDRFLRVKMFTPTIREIFNLLESDLNRPLADITTRLNFAHLLADVESVMDTLQSIEREVETQKGKWYLMRIYPYRTSKDTINGVVLAFINITKRIETEQAMRKIAHSREQQSRIFNTTLSSIADFAYTFDREGRFTYANKPLLNLLGITLEEISGKTFNELPYPKDLADKLQAQIRQVVETKNIVTDETPFTNPAGNQGYYEYIFSPVIGEDGTVEVVAGSTRDITERRDAEKSIRFQAKLLNTVEQSVIATNLDGKVIFWNQFAEKLYGWTAEEAIGRPVTELTTPDIAIKQAAEIMSELRHGKSWSGEFQVKRRDGTMFPAQVFNSPINDANGKMIGIVGVSVDITERNQVEEKLRRSESELRLVTDSIPSLISYVDKTEHYRFVNAGYEEWFEQPRAQIVGRSLEDVLGAAYPTLKDNVRRALAGETVVFESKLDYPHGQRFVLAQYVPDTDASGEVQGFYAHVTDIGEIKRAQEALREAAELNSTVLSSLNAQIAVLDADGNISVVNEAWQRFARDNGGENVLSTGVGANYLKVCRSSEGSPDDYALKALAGIEAVLKGELSDFSLEYPCSTPFDQRWFLLNVTPLRGGRGGAVVSHLDITERNRTEQALSKSEERLRLLIESASDYAIFTVTKDNLIDSWNTGAEHTFGWKENEIIGKSGAILFTPEDRERGVPKMEIQCATETGKAEDERWHIRKDGTRFYASGVMQPLRDGGIHGFVKICRDNTEKIEAEKAFYDKEMLQKLVGAQEDERKRIARDLHDELGQQLTALRLKLEATRKICEEEEICGKIDEMQLIAKQIDADVDFLAWELRPAALDDLGLIASLENYVREWSRHSGVTAEFHASNLKKMRLAPEVEINLYRITQEALNNTHKYAGAKSVSVMLEKRDNLIVLIVEDDGKGFNPKIKKNRNKGLGLIGMEERSAIVGGTFEIESSPKQGTTIFVRVPGLFVKKEKKNV